nr:NAD-dependent epimerase/dehydratase family protein [Candidatus Sigynarchaeum springense]
MDSKGTWLVTGAAGFMGSHLVEHLVKTKHAVRATSRPRKETPFFDRLGVEFIGADLTRPETLKPLFKGDVECVFHLGAICNFSTPYKMLRPTNVLGVENITKAALEAGVKRFIHVSSTSVYGLYKGTPFTESSSRLPVDSYGRSKRDGEDVVFNRIKEGLPATILRPCTVYGPRCTDGAGKVFSRATSISAIPGSGTQVLSNVRAEDVAAAAEHLARQEKTIGEVFNVADESHPTVEQALKLAAEVFETPIPTKYMPLGLVIMAASIGGLVAKIRDKIPDLEKDAVRYLYDDYIVDISKLKGTGFHLQYPDFEKSIRQLGAIDKKDR